MSAKGINYFFERLNMDEDMFKLFYDFSEDSGSNVPSVSLADTKYSGTLASESGFYDSSGSGFFDSNFISINHADELGSQDWTMILSYEKVDQSDGVLFSSLSSSGGFLIGVNSANKLFFEYNNGEPVIKTSSNSFAKKNAISVSKFGNTVVFCYYNFNTRKIEVENFIVDSNIALSDQWYIGDAQNAPSYFSGNAFHGYMDHVIYFSNALNPMDLEQLFSGVFAEKSNELGKITITGNVIYETGYVLSGVRYITSGQQEISGILTHDLTPVSIEDANNLHLFGEINNLCGEDFPMYIYDSNTGRFVDNSFYRLTGDMSILNESSSTTTGFANEREMIVGFETEGINIGTGIIGENIIELDQCLDTCGNLVNTYLFQDVTGTISGTTFLPVKEVFTGDFPESVTPKYSSDLTIIDVEEGCVVIENDSYIASFNFNGVTYLREIDNKDLSHILGVQNPRVRLGKEPSYDNARKRYKVLRPDVSTSHSLYLNGVKQFKTKDYDLTQNYFNSSGNYNKDDLVSYDSFILTERIYENLTLGVDNYVEVEDLDEDDLVFLNGQKLLRGHDYTVAGNILDFSSTALDTPIEGELIVLSHGLNMLEQSGNSAYFNNLNFTKEGSFLFLNGQRQRRNVDYLEISNLGLLNGSGEFKNPIEKGLTTTYNNNDRFFE